MTTYTVKAGDTLSLIASKYHVTVDAIAKANKITNPNLIRVGQVLTIPAAAGSAGTKTLSANGLSFLKSHEGCKLEAYQDSGGVWTIGYGHTGGVTAGMKITQAQADSYLSADTKTAQRYVNDPSFVPITADLTQNQFDALVSFAYNCGGGGLKQLCAGRTAEQIAAKMSEYNKVSGKVIPGLTNRRRDEVALFKK